MTDKVSKEVEDTNAVGELTCVEEEAKNHEDSELMDWIKVRYSLCDDEGFGES